MENIQFNLLLELKKYISKFQGNNFLPNHDNPLYLNTYSNSIGALILKKKSKIKKINFLQNFKLALKDFLYSLNYVNCSVIRFDTQKNYKKIIITWAFKNNFNKKGSLSDKYLNIQSDRLKDTLLIVIYMDEKIPKKVGKNIVLLKQNGFSLNFVKLFKILCNNFTYLFKDFNYFLSSISNYNFFSFIFLEKVKVFINKDVRFLIMPYEGQPFQNNIVSFIKSEKLKIKVIGCVHSPPLALPANFVRKKFSPDKIILHGSDQKYCFTNILGWKNSQVKLSPSFRFLKTKSIKENIIYLPFAIRNTDIILDALKYLHENYHLSIKNFSIKNHPIAFKSKKNLQLIELIKNFKKSCKKKNIDKKKYSIFVGSSGGIIEALERGSSVLQIVENPLFDIYSNKIWPSLVRKKIYENIYLYYIKKKGSLINLGEKTNKITSYIN